MEEKIEAYKTIESVDNDVVAKYKPKFLSMGGEHVVYEIPEHSDIVIKVPYHAIKMILDFGISHDGTPGEIGKNNEELARQYLNNERQRYLNFKKYFGADHVLNQRKYIKRVPITTEILSVIYDGDIPQVLDGIKEIETVVVIQSKSREISNDHISFNFGYIEDQIDDPQEYLKYLNDFVCNPKKGTGIGAEILNFPINIQVKKLIQESESDVSLRDRLFEFFSSAIKYSNETGETLDLIGKDNVIFFKNSDGTWNYKLLDALQSNGGWFKINEVFEKLIELENNPEITKEYSGLFLNGPMYISMMNLGAEIFGIKERINGIGRDINIDAKKVLENLKVFLKDS